MWHVGTGETVICLGKEQTCHQGGGGTWLRLLCVGRHFGCFLLLPCINNQSLTFHFRYITLDCGVGDLDSIVESCTGRLFREGVMAYSTSDRSSGR